jgi:hypothetical protein
MNRQRKPAFVAAETERARRGTTARRSPAPEREVIPPTACAKLWQNAPSTYAIEALCKLATPSLGRLFSSTAKRWRRSPCARPSRASPIASRASR